MTAALLGSVLISGEGIQAFRSALLTRRYCESAGTII